jgi:hypothetical protein
VNQSSALAPYVLYRVNPNGSEEQVSDHQSFEEGWQAGQCSVHEDCDHAYSLYRGDRRVAKFCHARLMPRRSADSLDWSVLS